MLTRHWLPAFIVLWVAYEAPEGLGARWLHQPGLAAGMMLAFLPVAYLVARALGLSMGAAYALEWDRKRGLWLAVGFLLTALAKTVAVLAGTKLQIYTIGAASVTGGWVPMAASLSLVALSTFVPSIAEDIVTRGFWARIPRWAWTGSTYVLFTSVVYVLNHIYRLANGPSEWLMLMCFGIAYAAGAWRTGTLWAAVGLHWGWNFTGSMLDALWNIETQNVTSARYLSAGVHICVALIVLATVRNQVGKGLRNWK
jgi:membrane protease YdiL (CAAX protease family)